MKRVRALCLLATSLVFEFAPLRAWASEGLDIPEALERKVPLEGLGGLHLMFSRLYNENLWLYAIVCTVLMAVVGMAFAMVTDLILKSMGMEISKIEHKE